MQFDNELCIEVLYFNLVKFCEEIYHIIQVLFHFSVSCICIHVL